MITPEQHQIRALRRHLRDLTAVVAQAIAALDTEMKQPSTLERGKRVARVCNALEMANDRARHFGLGQSLRAKGCQ